jgi:hypothetical protein|tara:strand:- start:702 stop:1097 length:396 start_codon:yes stop_codon:yes gene_type:complete
MSTPFVIGSNVKIPVSATDKVIYLVSPTTSYAALTLVESSNAVSYTVPVGRKLIIVQYQVIVGHTNCAVNSSFFVTSGGTQIQFFDLYHTNAESYVIDLAGYTEVAAGNTIIYTDVGCGSSGSVLGVETDV